jgi:hypothetical protein
MISNLKNAIEVMQDTYRKLSVRGKKLMDIAKATGKPLPSSVLDAYDAASKEYLRFANQVFAVLNKKNITVEQVIYTQGKPAVDAKGDVRKVKISAPLRPPVFIRTRGAEVGLGPIAIAGLIISGLLLSLGTGAYLTSVAVEKVTVAIKGPDIKPIEQVDAFGKFFDKMAAAGVPPDEIVKRWKGVTEQPSPWPVIALGAAGIFGAAYLASTYMKTRTTSTPRVETAALARWRPHEAAWQE